MRTFLSVKMDHEHLGEIDIDQSGDRYSLKYDPSWLDSGGFAISPHLMDDNCSPESLKRFLANLLPEGRWLEELSASAHVSKSNVFGLIAAIGAETTGALSFMIGAGPGVGQETIFRDVTAGELTERIAQRQDRSIAVWDGKPRLSVAGVQDKLPLLFLPDGRMGFGEGGLASTHILKFGTSRAMHLVVNEFVCMRLARQVKLPVAEVAFVRYGEPVLVVRRFDREMQNDQVLRRHLIDGCQMLDLSPVYKYERPFGKSGNAAVIRSGANLQSLFRAGRLCRVPAAAIKDMLNWVLFQLLIGNSDAHGKNISFFVGREGIEMAPAYDLVNLEMYGDEFDRDFAMAIGEAFTPEEVTPWELAEMCDACNLQQRLVSNTLKYLCEKTIKATEAISLSDLHPGEETDFAREMLMRIRTNAERYLSMAKELPKVTL